MKKSTLSNLFGGLLGSAALNETNEIKEALQPTITLKKKLDRILDELGDVAKDSRIPVELRRKLLSILPPG